MSGRPKRVVRAPSKYEEEEGAGRPRTGGKRKVRTTGGAGAGKRTKREKDPNAPKRPLSAYMFFGAERRPDLQKKGMNSIREIGKALGAEWRAMTDEDKVKYQEQAQADTERYMREKAAYNPPTAEDAEEDE